VSDVPALLHGPELPPAGVPARAHFHGDYLRVTRESGAAEDVAAESLQVDVTGFNEDVLQLSWDRAGVAHAVTVSDRTSVRSLLEQAPASVSRRLRGGHSRMRYHHHKWNVVMGILASLVLLAGIAWWQSEAITMWLANRVSLETEVGIGNQALAQLESENVLTQDGLAAETLASIGARLTKGSRYSYRWYVSDDREINAYALPGGIIVINAGMIEAAENAEELAAVLAHEVQHVEQRHTLQQMIHTAGWAAVLAVALGDVSAITAIVIHQLGNLRNSRKLEAQADAGGLEALAKAGIPLTGMATLFRKLKAEQDRRGGEGAAILSSHPATDERIAEIERLAQTLRCECQPLGIDWTAVQTATKEWRAAQ
jgi:predicted Zn-dependent protease